MPLLDKLKDKAVEAVNDEGRQKEWLESGFDELVEGARDLVGELPSDDSLNAFSETATYSIGKLEKHKGALVGLGQHGLRSTLIMVGLGQLDDAARHAALVKLREGGSWSDVTGAITASAREGNERKRKLDAQVKEIKEALGDIGTTAAKALLPFLFALL